MPYQQPQATPQYSQQQQSQPLRSPRPVPYSRPQAPVANMMSSPVTTDIPTTSQHPSSRPSSAPRRPSTASSISETPIIPTALVSETKKVSRINVSEKYTYLHDAEKARPQVYQSPYALGGGFSPAYLPAPAVAPKARPRGPSISQEYLKTRTPSEQEQINQNSMEDKVKAQQFQQQQQLQRRQSLSQSQTHGHGHSHSNSIKQEYQQPQHVQLSAIQQPPPSYHQPSAQAYHDPYTKTQSYQHYNHYSPSYAVTSLHHSPNHQPSYLHQPPPYPAQYQQPLTYQGNHSQQQAQYQSPQDFQLQLQREAQHSPQGGWLDQFSRGLQNAANQGGSQGVSAYGGASSYGGISYTIGGGGQGSPLKYEMGGAGTEMLPMMREGGRY